MRVEDVMTTDVMTVTPETPLKEAARMLVGRGVSGFPVVRDGVVVGVVSETDVVDLERGEFSHGDEAIRLEVAEAVPGVVAVRSLDWSEDDA